MKLPVTSKDRAALVVVEGLEQPLSYEIPKELDAPVIGSEVSIELGARQTSGWVVDTLPLNEAIEQLNLNEQQQKKDQNAGTQLGLFKGEPRRATLKQLSDPIRAFLPDQLQLFRWMSEYYGVGLYDVLDTAIPRRAPRKQVSYVRGTPLAKGLSEEDKDALLKKAPRQAELLERVLASDSEMIQADLSRDSNSARAALQALEKKGLVEIFNGPAKLQSSVASSANMETYAAQPEKLTPGQEKALEQIMPAIDTEGFAPFLLHGVTGSGKTEVYLRAIQHVLKQGGGALVVVPEIALTPQLVDHFAARLDSPLGVLHSQVGLGERWATWERLLSGEIRVAIGARSAVFAPFPKLSLVIVDEEHESSYKQSEGLRYNARDTAVMRARFANCPILLGSATPSFESLLNVKRSRYKILEMPERTSTRPLPRIEIIHRRLFKRKEMPSENVSPPLHQAIQETLDKNGQAVVLYNKRGFASFLQCTSCSEVVACPNCSVALTYHRGKHRLLCHYCDLSMSPPTHCPQCRDDRTTRIERDEQGEPLERAKILDAYGALEHRGAGTEKVVDELAELFPNASIVRMDRDTVGKKGAYREILGSMRSGEADILVGTQMIAKGHDLPGVTLVGIIDADVGLHLPDFRSSEKVFQLITQAAGRAGRGENPGRVIVQTNEPKHPTIVAAATGRFSAFARYELEFRKSLSYPPLGRLLRLVVSSTNAQDAYQAAIMVRSLIGELIERKVETREGNHPKILGPAPAPHERLKGRYRWHLLVKSDSAKILSELAAELNSWKRTVKQFEEFRLIVDIDPVDML